MESKERWRGEKGKHNAESKVEAWSFNSLLRNVGELKNQKSVVNFEQEDISPIWGSKTPGRIKPKFFWQ